VQNLTCISTRGVHRTCLVPAGRVIPVRLRSIRQAVADLPDPKRSVQKTHVSQRDAAMRIIFAIVTIIESVWRGSDASVAR